MQSSRDSISYGLYIVSMNNIKPHALSNYLHHFILVSVKSDEFEIYYTSLLRVIYL